MYGGRRKGRKTRKTRGGAAYGFGSAITPGALTVEAVNTSLPMNSNGSVNTAYAAADTATNAAVGGRRRKTRKGGKKSRTSRKTKKAGRRHKKMRGGASSYNAGSVGSGFVGGIPGFPTGGGTYGAYSAYAAKMPAGDTHVTGADGVKQLPA